MSGSFNIGDIEHVKNYPWNKYDAYKDQDEFPSYQNIPVQNALALFCNKSINLYFCEPSSLGLILSVFLELTSIGILLVSDTV